MFLSPERTFRRKVQEAVLAIWLESQLKKEDILLRYLNTAYFGAGATCGRSCQEIFREEGRRTLLSRGCDAGRSGMCAVATRANPQFSAERKSGRNRPAGHDGTKAITAAEAETARAQPVKLRTPPETPPGSNYFVDMVAGDVRRLLARHRVI